MVRWETVGLLVGHGCLLLGLRCDVRTSCLRPKGLKGSCFELFGDNPESSVVATFQLAQSGWVQSGLPGWGSIVNRALVTGPIDLKELVFTPVSPFGGK